MGFIMSKPIDGRRYPRGEAHHNTTLSSAKIRKIRAELAKRDALLAEIRAVSDQAIAERYGCSERYVRRIRSGQARKSE
jgi:hypothetical protein